MMSIGSVKSAGSAGNYYTDKDNYYVIGSMDERWQGKGAEALGLEGKPVDKAVFTEILKGKLPDGSDLTRMQDGTNKHRPGYDLTFSAPKSVSMMAMLGGDKRLIDAHNQAVTKALQQVETLAATRVMTDGKSETVLTGNLIVAKFTHDTNRNEEPQLHTHAVVMNATQNGDKWQSLGTDTVGKTGFIENVYANQIAFGKIYREELKPLVEILGYKTEVVGKHGMWEMNEVPVEPFSTRTQEVREAAGPDASLKSRDVAALDIHVLDELSVKALSQEVQRQNHVSVTPDASVVRQAPFSDAVSVLAQDRPAMGIVSGQGGAAGQRERVAELTLMAREQGRDVHILAADNRSRDFLAGDARLAGEAVTGKSALQDGTAFIPGGTLIIDQAEKLSLKETISLLDGAMRHNVQVLLSDSGKRSGTGSALTVLKDSGVNTYRWQGGHQVTADIISEPDKGARYSLLAQEFAASVREGQESVAQISGTREQNVLNSVIRNTLKNEGVLGEKEMTVTALTPVWLDSKSRGVRDYYREGMVMERWDPETRKHDRFVIDRVTASSNMLTLKDKEGERLDMKVSAVDSQWTLFRADKLPVAEGERLAVLGKIPDTRLKGGESITVLKSGDGQLTVQRPGQKTTQSLSVGSSPFDGIKVGHGWVESPGRSVSETATVFASVTQRELDNATLNQLAQSGSHLRLYSAQDAARTMEKLARHTAFSVVSEQLKARSGETDLDAAIAQQKAGLHTPAEQAIHLSVPLLESDDLTFTRPQLLATALETGGGKVSMADIDTTIQAQIRSGQLLNVSVSSGHGNDLLISRQTWDAEKSILTRVLEGKDAVAPLMDRVPASLMTGLTAGQRASTRMILETPDRFTVVQGYAGVGKTTQFRAVTSAISLLPEETRPRVIGLAPTHRAVGEMQSAGVDARTTASFLHDTQLLLRNGQTPDFSNTLFLIDESSMVGLSDKAKALSLIAAGGGRAVSSGDTDQLQSISPGQPFRLMQQRSAADVAIMKEIVRQVPELRPAVYSLIDRDVHRALTTIEQVTPEQVPRKEGAWAPGSSVVEFTRAQEKAIQEALKKGESVPAGQPATLYEALVKDYAGRTPEAQSQTLVITHLNKDRRALNGLIHDARRENGETGKEEITLPVLVTSNIRDGELRRLSTWTAHKEAVALVDNVYHRISKVDKDNQLITLTDSEGKERFISPREASAEGVTLYRREDITVSEGDRMRFSKSDPERGYVANSVWEVKSVSGDSVTLSDGKTSRTLNPKADEAQRHIDLAYAITAHGAQGASEPFAIALEGVAEGRKAMASFESAYVGLSRMKQHVQVYTDSREGWIKAINASPSKATAHDILAPRNDRAVHTAEQLFSRARPMNETAAGRAALQQSGLAKGISPGKFISPGKQYPQPHVALPVYDKNGKEAGIWLSSLTDSDGRLQVMGGEGRVMGNEDARFVALQGSRNGESLLAGNMGEGVRVARDNPDSGVVVCLAGDDRPWNPGAITGGRVWADPIPVVSPEAAGTDIPLPPEVLAQRAAEEAQRQNMEKQAEQTAREVAGDGRKAGESEDRVKEVIGDVIRGLEREKPGEEKMTLPDDPQTRKQEAAVQQVAQESLQRERLQQMERDMVRDLNREKTLGGD
ncbi:MULTISPECIES: conjugative transfer relaxase/helicase TraI [Enterobacteriaceae]|uniref:conjugative transfer relaxase/helicase TraI n=1 Tax=Enterobacteriaceae TaxID=543 RepID=UPI0019000390|nr:conjugative transfer relaxase/helicase TraI [Citrobacter freundii]ELH1434304.1 conjugative transfer relaxase/helicase TraI [Raoultella ornithinolytica]MBJ8803576.1 conjugative transfer relaxase/helicase TraI [Citrobacter freundii]HAT3825164.1 conjugative transfer relaxase/helicase TraI [Raoultella ornithinolytica]HEI9740636.1 conjugative transfer relaxase/helicase TraI [Citrobacter freundii]HEQ2050865.1 conjugative transfer relaxase/helicase TraI [Raoultella ornithinolytica]